MGAVPLQLEDGSMTKLEFDDTYSIQDRTGQDLSNEIFDHPSKTIYAMCLSQETPDSPVLPSDLKGWTFYNCNLDNVLVPEGNTIIGIQPKRFLVQNDLRDWHVDENNEPIKLIGEKQWAESGYPITLDSIPENFIRREINLKVDYEAQKNADDFKSWWTEDPQITKEETLIKEAVIPDYAWKVMEASGNYYPFDGKPKNVTDQYRFLNAPKINKDGEAVSPPIQVALLGVATYVTIEGKGIFKGGAGIRKMDNSINDLVKK